MLKVKRNLEERVKDLLQSFPVVVLVGARQVGKTELAKTVCPDWKYFDLENPGDFDRIQIDPESFFKENPHSLILDEAQEYPELFKILRGVIDRDRTLKGRYLLTGSSSPQLLTGISESLAGRVATLEVGTLKVNEFYSRPLSPFYRLFHGSAREIPQQLTSLVPTLTSLEVKEFWLKGGYPEAVLADQPSFFLEWMQEYQRTYIERDVKRHFARIQTQRYRRFISIVAELSGTILNRSELASLLDVSQPTITQYLSIADGTFLWRVLPSFAPSKSKSLVKMPKGHLRDSGLLHFLTKVPDLETLLRLPSFGRSFESFVIEEILKGLSAAGVIGWEYFYYRTRSRAEIDLILNGRFGMIPIEIKFSSKADPRDLTHMKSFLEEYRSPFGILVNQSESVEKLTENIYQVPIGLI